MNLGSWVNPQECVWKTLYRIIMRTIFAGIGDKSLQHCNLVHKFIPMPQAKKIPAAKAAVDGQGMGKLEKIPEWNLTKVRSKKEVIDEARTTGAKVHFAPLMDICHWKNAELETEHQKYKGRVVLRGDLCERRFRALMRYSLNRDHQHHKWQDRKSWKSYPDCQGCEGQAADAVSAYTQVIMEDAPNFLKIHKSECPDIWIRLPRHKWHKIMVQYGRSSRSSWTESPWASFGRTVMGKAIWESPLELRFGRRFPIGNACSSQWKSVILICVCGWHKIGWKETKHWSDVESNSIKKSIRENQHLSLIMYTWDVLKDNVK